jgi:hypothetical protein
VIGTSGSFDNTGATKQLAFDGSLRNLFDAPDNIAWAGLDLGVGVRDVVSTVAYAPRKGVAGRMVGGKFQASSTPTQSRSEAIVL